MASLNTLRTRGGIIVSIVIGIALLAFILSDASLIDFVTGGGNRDPQIAEIEGAKIKYSDYYTERTRLENVTKSMMNRSSLNQEESEAVDTYAWEKYIMQYGYRPGFERLGINVGEQEQVDMSSGQFLSPVIVNTFVNPQTGMFDPAYLREFIDMLGAGANRETIAVWNNIKEQMVTERELSKFLALVHGGMFITDLEVENSIRNHSNTVTASLVGQKYADIADSTVTVPNSELREFYNKHKRMFRQTPSRTIEYVTFDILPAEQDFEAARTRVEELAKTFAESNDPLQYAYLNSPDDRTPAVYVRKTQVEPVVADYIFKGEMYGPVLEGDTYIMSRLGETRMMPDSVRTSHIFLGADEGNLADSLLTALRRGANFNIAALSHSQDRNTSMLGGDMGTFAPENVELNLPEFTEAVLNARVGDIIKVEAPYGIQIVKIVEKSPAVEKVKVATIKYVVKAGSATQSTVVNQAQKFYTDASSSYDNFKKASSESALTRRTAIIANTDREVSGLADSRELVRWAYNNKKGSVSEPIAVGLDHFVVAAVTDIKEDETASFEDVSASIENVLINRKKADIIAARMQGGSLEQIAANIGAEVTEIDNVNFNSFYLPEVGIEPALIGAVSTAAKDGAVSKPVKGLAGVYVFSADAINQNDPTTEEDEKVRIESTSNAFLNERITQALLENIKIKDDRVKYF